MGGFAGVEAARRRDAGARGEPERCGHAEQGQATGSEHGHVMEKSGVRQNDAPGRVARALALPRDADYFDSSTFWL